MALEAALIEARDFALQLLLVRAVASRDCFSESAVACC